MAELLCLEFCPAGQHDLLCAGLPRLSGLRHLAGQHVMHLHGRSLRRRHKVGHRRPALLPLIISDCILQLLRLRLGSRRLIERRRPLIPSFRQCAQFGSLSLARFNCGLQRLAHLRPLRLQVGQRRLAIGLCLLIL